VMALAGIEGSGVRRRGEKTEKGKEMSHERDLIRGDKNGSGRRGRGLFRSPSGPLFRWIAPRLLLKLKSTPRAVTRTRRRPHAGSCACLHGSAQVGSEPSFRSINSI
jgi:hypothetical protein